jgi:hypothetical protein
MLPLLVATFYRSRCIIFSYSCCILFSALYSFSFTGSTGNKTGKILAIVLPIVAVVVALAAVMICSSIWRSKRKTQEKPSLPGYVSSVIQIHLLCAIRLTCLLKILKNSSLFLRFIGLLLHHTHRNWKSKLQ